MGRINKQHDDINPLIWFCRPRGNQCTEKANRNFLFHSQTMRLLSVATLKHLKALTSLHILIMQMCNTNSEATPHRRWKKCLLLACPFWQRIPVSSLMSALGLSTYAGSSTDCKGLRGKVKDLIEKVLLTHFQGMLFFFFTHCHWFQSNKGSAAVFHALHFFSYTGNNHGSAVRPRFYLQFANPFVLTLPPSSVFRTLIEIQIWTIYHT